MRKMRHCFYALFLVLILVCSMVQPVVAAEKLEPEEVRIGYFEASGYQEQKSNGGFIGYGYEYYEQLAKYTGWKNKYITGLTWEQCLEQLEQGKLDIVGFATKTEDRQQRFDYASIPAGETYTAMYVSADEKRYAYEDFEDFDGMKVGVMAGSNHITALEEYCAENHFSVELAYYPDQEALMNALQEKEVDAIVTTLLKKGINVRLVARFNPTAFYFITKKGNEKISGELNSALVQLQIVNPYYNAELSKKYFSLYDDKAALFTKEDRRFLKESPPIRVVYLANRPPISYIDQNTRTFSGITADVFSLISQRTGLQFEYIPAKNNETALKILHTKEADLIADFDKNYSLASQNNLNMTDPYLTAPFLVIQNKSRVGIKDQKVILSSNLAQMAEELDLKGHVGIYPNLEECFKALKKGKATTTYANSYVADHLLSDPSYSEFSATTLVNLNNELCIAIPEDSDPRLMRVLNKSIHAISTETMNDVIVANTIRPVEVTWEGLIYQRPVEAVIMLSIIFMLLVIALCAFTVFRNNREKKIRELMYMDSLTGHWSFNRFRQEANQVLEEEERPQYALLYLDIDKFKYINDTFGYGMGDKILRNISNILSDFIESDEMCARVSADTFVALLTYNDEEDLSEKLNELSKALSEVSHNPQEKYRLVILGGVYILQPRDKDITTAIDRACFAKETVVGAHRNTLVYYNDAIRDELKLEKSLEEMMEHALEHGEFVPYLQPKVDINTRLVVGAEALARWQHPEYGLISPAKFIPVFEKNGFIVSLDFYIFEEICKAISRWFKEGHDIIPISCNFSRVHLLNKDFPDHIKAITDHYGISPKYLELEITESIAMDTYTIIEQIERLKQMGFIMAIDDFGTGYSSLGVLQTLPMDVLKLDKSFLKKGFLESREKTILQGVISIADHLEMQVICEGIETTKQLDLLREIGCHLAQGYLYAKPMPLADFEKKYLQLAGKSDGENGAPFGIIAD